MQAGPTSLLGLPLTQLFYSGSEDIGDKYMARIFSRDDLLSCGWQDGRRMPQARQSIQTVGASTQSPQTVDGFFSLPQMRYPNEYVWFLMFSSMDIMLTWVILSLGGSEVNPVAALVIDVWGLTGAIVFKFSLTLMVILICETIGRTRDRTARSVAQLAIVLSAMPVMYSMLLLAWHILFLE